MIELKIEGAADIADTLKRLSAKVQSDIALHAVVSALTPIVNSAKRHAHKSRDTGALVESIGFRVKKYSKGRGVFAVVGPRRGFKGPDGRDPVKYAHLVEFGHFGAAGTGKKVRSAKGRSIRKGTLFAQSFILPQPFLRPAWHENKEGLAPQIAKVMGERIQGEVSKRTARRNARKTN